MNHAEWVREMTFAVLGSSADEPIAPQLPSIEADLSKMQSRPEYIQMIKVT
jgi:hypothetical protein